MFFELNINLNHVIELVLNKIRENNIRLIARRQGIPRPCQQILRLIQVQTRSNTKAKISWLIRNAFISSTAMRSPSSFG